MGGCSYAGLMGCCPHGAANTPRWETAGDGMIADGTGGRALRKTTTRPSDVQETTASSSNEGTLSSLVTTPLWLRSRHHAAELSREVAADAAENLARAAETRHLIEVRIPAMLARVFRQSSIPSTGLVRHKGI